MLVILSIMQVYENKKKQFNISVRTSGYHRKAFKWVVNSELLGGLMFSDSYSSVQGLENLQTENSIIGDIHGELNNSSKYINLD